jgi:hypothetical protein
MVAEEVIVTILILLLKSKKVIFQVSYKTIWSQSRNSDLRLRGVGVERYIFDPATLLLSPIDYFFSLNKTFLQRIIILFGILIFSHLKH